MIEDRAVRLRLPEIVRPGVDMRVEVNERDRAVPLRECAQQRQRDAVIAAERDEMRDTGRLLLDQRQALGDIAERNGEIANIGERQRRRIDPMHRMIAIDQHAACLSDRRRTEARAGAIGGAEIEGNAGDADRRGRIVARDAEKARRNGEGGDAGHDWTESPALNKKTAAATTQVHSPRGAPTAAEAIDWVSTIRLLIS